MADIKKRIEKIEERLFYLDMIDRWDTKTYEIVSQLEQELTTLKAQLA